MTTETEQFDASFGDALASVDTTAPAATAPAEPAPAPAAAEPAPAAAAAAPTEPSPVTPAETPPSQVAAPAAGEGTPPAAAPAPAAEVPETPPAASAADIGDPATFAAAVAAAIAASQPPAPAAPAPTPAAPAADVPLTLDQFLTDDDKKTLAAYDKEWGEVATAEAIRRRAELQFMQATMYNQLEKVLAPIVQNMQQSQVTSHFATIRSQHPDFDTVLPGVKEWVAKQPSLYRPALERVLNQGNAGEVVELVGAYKQAVGQTGAVPAVPASLAPQAPAAPATIPVVQAANTSQPASAAAIAATAAVVSQRSNNQTAADPSDFETAFREALAA